MKEYTVLNVLQSWLKVLSLVATTACLLGLAAWNIGKQGEGGAIEIRTILRNRQMQFLLGFFMSFEK